MYMYTKTPNSLNKNEKLHFKQMEMCVHKKGITECSHSLLKMSQMAEMSKQQVTNI